MRVKALACELPYEAGIPLSRFRCGEIAAEAVHRGIVAQISGATVWRWLDEDAIKPWQHRSWIYPRDPAFEEKAGRVLDLYQGKWHGETLGSNDYVICCDEKTSIQARVRIHATQPAQAHQSMRVEHEYQRGGALAYMGAWDVKGAKVFGRCERKSGIGAFEGLVDDVMSHEPYCSARRVFWVVDNGSSHRGLPSVERMRIQWPNAELVHLPVHASWLNQMEIYFGIVQRKVLTPNDFGSLDEVAQRLKEFERHYERVAKPFEWKFTRDDLSRRLRKLREDAKQRELAA